MDINNLIEKLVRKYNVDSVGIFGSRARGDYREDSDYDIFIIGELTLDDELHLEEKLEDVLEKSVDLIKINKDTDRMLLKNIFNESYKNEINRRNNSRGITKGIYRSNVYIWKLWNRVF